MYKKKTTTRKTKAKKVKKKTTTKRTIKKTKKVTPAPTVTTTTTLTPPKKPTSTRSEGNYLSKKELLGAVMESKRLGKMSDNLAKKLHLLTTRYAKDAKFARYTFNDDMKAYAMMMLVKTWNSFNPQKSDNPFAFYTQCIKNSFIQYLNQEKRQRNVRDMLLVDQGLSPSFTYQMEHEGEKILQDVERDNNQTYYSGHSVEGSNHEGDDAEY